MSTLAVATAVDDAEARIRALKAGFLALSGLALLAVPPCRWLPRDKPDEIPA